MTHTNTCYQMMSPTGRNFIGRFYNYDTVEEAIGETAFQVERSHKAGYNCDEKWLIIKVTTATITDDKGWFVSETTDRKAIGIYDNGTVTMY